MSSKLRSSFVLFFSGAYAVLNLQSLPSPTGEEKGVEERAGNRNSCHSSFQEGNLGSKRTRTLPSLWKWMQCILQSYRCNAMFYFGISRKQLCPLISQLCIDFKPESRILWENNCQLWYLKSSLIPRAFDSLLFFTSHTQCILILVNFTS